MSWWSDPQSWIAFLTLAALEIVLGIDNIVFISILVGKLPPHQQAGAYRIGLSLAMVMRILLLLSLSWIMGLVEPLFTIPLVANEVSGRDLVLIVGGLFLVAKSTMEVHEKLEGHEGGKSERGAHSYASVLAQIMALDVVFSLDSVITAVGMVQQVAIMIAAVVVAVLVMMVFARPIGRFVSRHPTVKMLALAFLLAIGMMLITDGFGYHVPKGYLYFAMAFSLFVEMLNLRAGHREPPVHLRQPYVEPASGAGGDMRTPLILLATALLAGSASAAEVYLKGGGQISGRIVTRSATTIEVDVGAGRIGVPASSVVRIEEGRSAFEEYEERAAALAASDADGWVALGGWAESKGLGTQARQAYERALAVSPTDPRANEALGKVHLDGKWVSEEESYKTRGFVQYEGAWMTPAEHDALLRERAAEEHRDREVQAADARAREAEARAAEAEAKAREAEAQEGDDIYYPAYGWGGGPAYWPVRPVVPARPIARPRPR